MTYAGGVAGTEGLLHTALGPFDMQPGSVLSYGRVSYERDAFQLNMFANLLRSEAPSLLVPDGLSGKRLQLDFTTQTYDIEARYSAALRNHAVTYGGNYRRNNFDISLAPGADERNEFGGFIEDEISVQRFRFTVGARVYKFSNIEDPAFSPRVNVAYQPTQNHTVRFGLSQAFRSPSANNNFLDVTVTTPTNIQSLAPLVPPSQRGIVNIPFPLPVRAVGSEVPFGDVSGAPLRKERLTAYEIAYMATFQEWTTLGVAFYVHNLDDTINFTPLPDSLDSYTSEAPPLGWPVAPSLIDTLAASGEFLPRTAFAYLNLGPTRNKGVEVSIDHRVNSAISLFANYSWQDDPVILDDPDPFPATELTLPPTHRFNAGATYNGPRFLGSATVNYTDGTLWGDVLDSQFHGFTEPFTMINAGFGIRWRRGFVTTSIKGTNLVNDTIQHHIFGDLFGRAVTAQVRFEL